MEEREKLTEKIKKIYKDFGLILLELGTGVGKSLQAILLIRPKEKWLIVIPKLVLIQNWKDEFIKWNINIEDYNIEFCTYAGLEKFAASKQKRNIILDEAHNMNERRYVAVKDILNLMPLSMVGTGRGHLIALSATIDEDRRHLLHRLGISKENTIKFTTDHAVEADIVSDYRVLVVHIPLDNIKSQPLRFNKWKTYYNMTEEEVYSLLNTKYIELTRQGLDTMWITLDRMKFLYDLPSKNKAAYLILGQLNKDRRILTFGSSIDQIENLCEYTHHSKKSKKDTTFKDFCDGKISRLGAIQTISEGVNVPNLDTGFVVQAMSKKRHVAQRTGRLLRKDPENPNKQAMLIMLSITNTQDEKWVRNSLSYLDSKKIHHTTIKEVENLGIESIIANL